MKNGQKKLEMDKKEALKIVQERGKSVKKSYHGID
jgi:hypothetical protein